MRKGLAIAAALFIATPAYARVEFASYEGPDSIQVGEGGTKVTRDGIDFWTMGAPPRRFLILVILTDVRQNRIFDGQAIGCRGLARRAREAGGNGLILLGQSQQDGGIRGGWVPVGDSVSFFARRRTDATTQFLVVRYLD